MKIDTYKEMLIATVNREFWLKMKPLNFCWYSNANQILKLQRFDPRKLPKVIAHQSHLELQSVSNISPELSQISDDKRITIKTRIQRHNNANIINERSKSSYQPIKPIQNKGFHIMNVLNLVLKAIAPLAISIAISSANATTYSFTQDGFEDGGLISGTFEGTDSDHDGQIIFLPTPDNLPSRNEVTSFSMSFSGTSSQAPFTATFANLYGLVYTIGRTTLGSRSGEGEGLGVDTGIDTFEGHKGVDYTSGVGPTGSLGALIFSYPDHNLIASSPNLIQVSTVPEPETYALLLIGFGFISFVVRHRNKN